MICSIYVECFEVVGLIFDGVFISFEWVEVKLGYLLSCVYIVVIIWSDEFDGDYSYFDWVVDLFCYVVGLI